MLYGYRISEQELPIVGLIKDGTVIKLTTPSDPALRPPVKVSLGCHIAGVSLPHVDHTDTDTVIAGIKKRFACKPLSAADHKLLRLRTFTALWCCANLVPLPSDTDVSLDSWLELTGYSRARKNQLKQKWLNCGGVLNGKHYTVKSFVKDECYPEFKHARWINARSDEFKCAVGPIFKQIEKSVFSSDWFIKKIPCKDRAKFIFDRCFRTGVNYVCTDYTAFEAHFIAELMDCCEFVMYRYMTQHLPDAEKFDFYLRHVIAGQNKCVSKLVTVKIDATRMSGEMCTSLGNGFSNLMFMLFLAEEKGCTNVVGVVEGDDGIFVMNGPHPTADDFKTIGLNIKMVVVDDLTRASFCGLIFSTEDLINIADPIKIIAQTGFSTQQYVFSKSKILRGLLKAKAFSLLYQYPGCPVISSFSKYLLRNLVDDYVYFRKNQGDYVDLLQKEAFSFYLKHGDTLSVDTGMSTRILMESYFGVSIAQQLHLESYFDNLGGIVVLEDDVLIGLVPLLWKQYANQYMKDAPLDPWQIRHFFD